MSSETKRMEREFEGGSVAKFGTFYPTNYVVAVVRDPAKAEQAAEALVAANFEPSDVALYTGDQVLDHHQVVEQQYAQHRGLLQRLAELFPGDEREAMNQYLDAAKAGASIVTVYAPEHDRRRRAGALLKEHGGSAVRFYGDKTYTDL